MKARLLVVDDHSIVREGLRLLASRTADLEVAAEAENADEAAALARSGCADLMVLDLALPGVRGMQVLQALRAERVALPVLVFSMYPAEQFAAHVRRAGGQGYVPKTADPTEVLRAARRILAGGTAFPERRTARRPKRPAADPFEILSHREREVMQGLVAGASLMRIAADLGVDAKSVSTYRRRLLDKLEVKTNAELVALALRRGFA